jgi:hypothetical protein
MVDRQSKVRRFSLPLNLSPSFLLDDGSHSTRLARQSLQRSVALAIRSFAVNKQHMSMPPKAEIEDVELQPLVLGDSSERSQASRKAQLDVKEECDEDNTQGKNKWTFKSSGGVKALSACGLYSFCSVGMILVNKSLASR